MSLDHAIAAIQAFQGSSLTKSLSAFEHELHGFGVSEADDFCTEHKIDDSFLSSALELKKVGGLLSYTKSRAPSRKERSMQRFRSDRSLQKFVSIHAQFHNHFDHQRHLISRKNYRLMRSEAMSVWQAMAA